MNREVSPILVGVVVVVLLAAVGWFFLSRAGGRTFTKDEARGGQGGAFSMKMGK